MKLVAERSKTIEIPGDEDKGFIQIRNLSMEEVAQIESKYVHVTMNDIKMDNFAERDADFARACLKGWGNLYDPSGRDLKFNPKNIATASAFVVTVVDPETNESLRHRFYEWINNEREKFAEEVEAEEEAALGN